MRKFLKQHKGISLISLTITIIIIIILTSVLIYNAKDGTQIKKLQNMYNDIAILREKIASYYAKYGDIPANVEYTNIGHLKDANVIGANDSGKFYVIDLKAIEGLTLSYGEGYGAVEEGSADVNSINDIYIINKNSQNIFYVQGIEIKQGNATQTYYTDLKEIDTAKVNTRVVEGVRIPDGYYYVGGTKQEGIVISDVQDDDLDNTKQGNQFVWVPVENPSDMYGILEDWTKAGKLYDYTSNNPKPLNWTEENGVMKITDLQSVREPDTISDANHDSNTTNLDIIKNILTETANNYSDVNSFKRTLQKDYKNMINSVEKYKGFYVGRYETSLDENGNAQSKKNKISLTSESINGESWYGFYARQKKFAINNNNIESHMICGSQWESMMRWMKKNDINIVSSTPKEGVSKNTGNITGAVENDKVNNIYDLLGNRYEWVTEASGQSSRTIRGGVYNEDRTLSTRMYTTMSTNSQGSPDWGSRMTIYIKVEDNSLPTVAEVQDESVRTNTENTKVQDEYGNIFTLPAGFSVSTESNTVPDGIVITDGTNEFVWVPVNEVKNANSSKIIALNRYTFDSNGVPTGQGETVIENSFEELSTSPYGNKTAIDIEAFKQSTNANNGYYIGRYEARKITKNHSYAVQINKDEFIYNNITQAEASTKCREMYSGKPYTTDLINSYAWDTALVYIQNFSGDTDYSNQMTLNLDFYNTGTVGTSSEDKVCNIFDMASNAQEWSTESFNKSSHSTLYGTLRGGVYEYGSGHGTVAYIYNAQSRAYNLLDTTENWYSFRPILYINNP